jgi:glycosyltransferase involved in cell wall biosynthesis
LQRAAARASRDSNIVHAQWAPTAAFAKSRALNAPVVVTLHGSDVALSERGGIWRRLLERGLRPPTAAVIAVSNELADRLRGSLPADLLPRLSVVHSGIERSLLERARDPRDPAMPVSVAFVGRLLESKGVLDLAEAFAAVSSPARLVVVGDGPARDAMQRILATRGVTPDRVSFLGALDRERALEAMAQADLVVAPSHAEGAGLVAVEASALGTCVLGTRTGIMPEVLDDDQLVGVGDRSALTGALVRLAADEGARQRLAAAARSRVAASFTWDVLAERVERVYREVLGAREGS